MKEIKMFGQQSPTDRHYLDVAIGPHCRVGTGLAAIHQCWVLALLPAIVASFSYFGSETLRVFGLAVSFAIAFDLLAEKLAPSRDLTSNWSSVSLALLLAAMLPLNAPWWLIMVGCFLLIIVGKKFFGGVGAYPAHPVALTIAILQLSWPQRMDYTFGMKHIDWSISMIEPLRLVKSMGASAAADYSLIDMLLGQQVAGTASGMVLFLLAGALLLLYLKEIQWQIPAGFFLGILLAGGALHLARPETVVSPLFSCLSGGTVLMGFFLLTDHTTSPVNKLPLFLYGLLAGTLLILIRSFSVHADGIVFAVLISNLCWPLMDMIKPQVKGAGNV